MTTDEASNHLTTPRCRASTTTAPTAADPAPARVCRLHRGDHPATPRPAGNHLGPLVVKILDSAHRPPAFVMGGTWLVDGRGGRLRTVVSGGVADTAGGLHAPGPAHAGAQRPDRRSGRRARRRRPAPWANSSARPRAGKGGSRCWTSSCLGEWPAGHNPRQRPAGRGSGWSPPVVGADRPDRRRGGLEPTAPDRQVPPAGRAAAQDRGPAGRFDAVWRRLDERRPLDWGGGSLAAMRRIAVADG